MILYKRLSKEQYVVYLKEKTANKVERSSKCCKRDSILWVTKGVMVKYILNLHAYDLKEKLCKTHKDVLSVCYLNCN